MTKYLTIQEVAAHARVSKMTVYRLVKDETLEAVHVGRTIRIPEGAWERYLKKQTTGGDSDG